MSKAMLIVGIILLAIITFGAVNIMQHYQTGNELDYYLLRETTEAAMTDAIDLGYYRLSGLTRMDKEKFVESFVRRFADSVDTTRNYQLSFYDLNEVPPKVSVKVDSSTVLSFKGSDLEMSTKLDAILENTYKTDPLVTTEINDPDSDFGKPVEE